MASEQLRARAPLRVSFAGGGTDVPPFPEREGGLVLSATIDRFAYGALAPRTDHQIGIESLDLCSAIRFANSDAIRFDGEFDLIKAAIAKFAEPQRSGFDLFLRSNAVPGSGLGSSSAMMVVLIGLLKEHRRMMLDDYEVAELAYSLEREQLGILGGLQDQYAASFGGFNFIEFYGEQVVVNPLRIASASVLELECNMLLCYTGKTRRSDSIIVDQTARYEDGNTEALDGLRHQKDLAVAMKKALLRGRVREFGSLLGTAWEWKKLMSKRISNPFIDEAYDLARDAGAIGGKVTGAGGGGYMLFYCEHDRKHRVAEVLVKLGCEVSDLAFTPVGLTTWRAGDG
jgi:D-glycero-alpha-D-manno-heptose-7-phosphate kinase